ncbi:hypothetical protein SAMN04488137_1685 [Fictibacillus solisalsi]|uniref:Uncharacterized protein n=1 Tax=Fictibacillus solisalsi TaxID=459525 RepID=A0A1G9VNT0_9BACL|nr:hypothetical protein SAMN04488137_1685 [Fictibacillus solisalsi]
MQTLDLVKHLKSNYKKFQSLPELQIRDDRECGTFVHNDYLPAFIAPVRRFSQYMRLRMLLFSYVLKRKYRSFYLK